MEKILFHTLQGISGWSGLNLKKIDIGKIISISCRKRWFKIFYKEYDYTLTIKYNKPVQYFVTQRLIGGSSGSGQILNTKTSFEQTITKRYKTKEDIDTEMKIILNKQKKLEKILHLHRKELLNKHKKYLTQINKNKILQKIKNRNNENNK